MRTLKRNQSVFYFATFKSKKEIYDDYGNYTGEYEINHNPPMKFYANISASKGETNTRQFGEDLSYDKILIMDRNPDIDEYTILWIDTIPEIIGKEEKLIVTDSEEFLCDDKGNIISTYDNVYSPHDYVVKKVAKSLNSVSIAISKVSVTSYGKNSSNL